MPRMRTCPSFTPALFMLATTTDNAFRTVDPVSDSSLFWLAELPLSYRARRWQGSLRYRPGLRRHRDLPSLDRFDSSSDVALRADLDSRTRLSFRADTSRTSDLIGLAQPDIVAPRTDRFQADGEIRLDRQLGTRTSLGLVGEYQLTDYLDGEFERQQRFGLTGNYSWIVSTRASLTATLRGDQVLYEAGDSAQSLTARSGFDLRLGPRTDLDLSAGTTWIVGDRTSGGDTSGSEQTARSSAAWRFAFRGSLRHSGRAWSSSVTAERRLGSGVALGQPTIRTQLSTSIGASYGRLIFGISGGYAHNAVLGDGPALAILGGDLFTSGTAFETVSGCADLAYRLTRVISLVGFGRLAHQSRTGGSAADLDSPLSFDVYRVSLGLAVHPFASSTSSRSIKPTADENFRKLVQIGSC